MTRQPTRTPWEVEQQINAKPRRDPVRTVATIVGLCAFVALVWAVAAGCAEPAPDSVRLLTDENGDVYRTELVWSDGVGWIRVEVIDDAERVDITRRGGERRLYQGRQAPPPVARRPVQIGRDVP